MLTTIASIYIHVYMTLIIMWYQKVCNCRQYCFDLVRSHQCSTAFTPLVPRVYVHEITYYSIIIYIIYLLARIFFVVKEWFMHACSHDNVHLVISPLNRFPSSAFSCFDCYMCPYVHQCTCILYMLLCNVFT